MKHAKKPTYTQRKLIEKWKLNARDWLVERDTTESLVLVHRFCESTTRTIPKEQ